MALSSTFISEVASFRHMLTTIFFNRKGELVYAHPGPYKNAADLIADVKRYSL